MNASDIEIFHATASFGARRWMTSASRELQFSTKEDAEAAVRLALLLARRSAEETLQRAAEAIHAIIP